MFDEEYFDGICYIGGELWMLYVYFELDVDVVVVVVCWCLDLDGIVDVVMWDEVVCVGLFGFMVMVVVELWIGDVLVVVCGVWVVYDGIVVD